MAAELIVNAMVVYAATGFVFACVFAIRGAGRVDPAAAKSGGGFRAIILPGAAALWPFLLYRWMRAGGER